MKQKLEGVEMTATRARFFELTVGNHQVEPPGLGVSFVSLDYLELNFPDIYSAIPEPRVFLKSVRSPVLDSDVTIREIGTISYYEGKLKVLVDQFKRSLLGESLPACCKSLVSYHLSIGNFPEVLDLLACQPMLLARIEALIEEFFPTPQIKKIRERQGFSIWQLAAISGVPAELIEQLETSQTNPDQVASVKVKAKLMQHLFTRAFR